MHPLLKFSLIAALAGMAIGCAPGGDSVSVENITVELTAEGPLFEGSNTALGNWKVDFSPYLDQHPKKFYKVRFTNVRVMADGFVLGELTNNLTLQLAASNLDMKKIAFSGNLQQTQEDAELNVAEEQKKLAGFFQGDEITFVLDFDFKEEEWYEDLNFSLAFDLEMNVEF